MPGDLLPGFVQHVKTCFIGELDSRRRVADKDQVRCRRKDRMEGALAFFDARDAAFLELSDLFLNRLVEDAKNDPEFLGRKACAISFQLLDDDVAELLISFQKPRRT